ncbi:ABC transporter ATP-binding protein [Acuticoccus kandeliae]|uniref:ABC transporter ATP-binding protein n=1 Tax=Acuticoccus kandeliae TaxID=2073160 RepID=UPI000D3E76B6|nr:oligopeptide/dipeptide ABC transporter ATP-binding protein [Acuticoccus kandeliae]
MSETAIVDAPPAAPTTTTAAKPLAVENLTKHYSVNRGILSREVAKVHAVDGVSFDLGHGETLGLVGESGCGKSTVGRCILRLVEPTSGVIRLAGEDVTHLDRAAMRPHRQRLQAIFQDPYSSLNQRMKAGEIVAEPLVNFGRKPSREEIAALFERVGLRPEQMDHYPHEFSGGQRQRLVIAKALSLQPSVIVCDEAVSALDVSVQAQVINLLTELQEERGIAYLFIAHDLAVVEHISHRIAVMYLGEIVELADKRDLFEDPLHPYTNALLSAVPVPDPEAKRDRTIIAGDVPSPLNPPKGCRFNTRCPKVFDRCRVEPPAYREVKPRHYAACHLND